MSNEERIKEEQACFEASQIESSSTMGGIDSGSFFEVDEYPGVRFVKETNKKYNARRAGSSALDYFDEDTRIKEVLYSTIATHPPTPK